jgi:hypothetical protein
MKLIKAKLQGPSFARQLEYLEDLGVNRDPGAKEKPGKCFLTLKNLLKDSLENNRPDLQVSSNSL